jgi:site-specific DNA recombinase
VPSLAWRIASGKKRVTARPTSEWVRNAMPDLRIVPAALWQRVEKRHAASAAAGANIREGIKRAGRKAGRSPAYLFSSLLRCGVCNSPMSIIGGSGKFKS